VHPIESAVATQVDYQGLARQRAALNGHLHALSAVTPDELQRWPRDERLAFRINPQGTSQKQVEQRTQSLSLPSSLSLS